MKIISRRQEGGEAYNLKVTRCTYVEEVDDNANKDSAFDLELNKAKPFSVIF